MNNRISGLVRRAVVAIRSLNLSVRSVGMILIASVIPILIVGFGAYFGTLRVFEQSNYNSIQKSIDLYGVILDNALSEYQATSSEVATNIETTFLLNQREGRGTSYYARLSRYYSYLERKKTRFLSTIEIIGVDGKRLYYPYLYSVPDRQNGLIDTLLAAPERTVWMGITRPENMEMGSSPPDSLFKSPYSMLVSTKIRSPYSQDIVGVVNVAISCDVLSGVMEQALESETDASFPFNLRSIFVVDQQGIVLSSYDKSQVGSRLPEEFEAALNTSAGELRQYRVKNAETGDQSLVFYTRTDRTGFSILSLIDYSDFIKDFNFLQRTIALLVAAVITLAVLIAYVHTISIQRPIREIMHGMRQVERGDLSVRIEDAGKDELHYLTARFNDMLAETRALLSKSVESEKAQREAEMTALEAQINPHFLYNTLDMISWMAYQGQSEQIPRLIEALSSFFRLSLNGGRRTYRVSDEIAHVRAYTDIQNERMRNAHHVEFHFDVDPAALRCETIRILLQPLVENAVLHGLLPKGVPGNVWISVLRMNGEVIFSVVDDGVGLSHGRNHKQFCSRYGLTSVNERVQLMYGESYGLQIVERGLGGVEAVIHIPAREGGSGDGGPNPDRG